MSDEGIRFFLPYFLLFFIVVIFFWGNITKRKDKWPDFNKNNQFIKRFSLINRLLLFFKTILILYTLIISIFIYFPDLYNYYFYPIDNYNTPRINGRGFHLLKITFVWFIVVQVYIDRLLLNKRFDNNKKQSLLIKAHGLLFIGLFLLFVFYTLIATGYFTLTLLFLSVIILIAQMILKLIIPEKINS